MSKNVEKLSKFAMNSQDHAVGPQMQNPSTVALNALLEYMAMPAAGVTFMQEKVPGEGVWLPKATVRAGGKEQVYLLGEYLLKQICLALKYQIHYMVTC